jgi:hypothetical protein
MCDLCCFLEVPWKEWNINLTLERENRMHGANEGISNARASWELSGQGSLSFGGVKMQLKFGAYHKRFRSLGGVLNVL